MTENFQEGCILLSRSIINSSVFQNEKWLKVWLWCLLKANHKKQMVPITTGKGQTVVEIDRGQFIFGRHKAAESLKMNPSTVRNVMEKLEKLQNIAMQKDTHYSIVTICNYEQYQSLENYKGQAKGQATDNQRTGKGQPKDTNKNEENVKNEKKEIKTVGSKRFSPPSLEEVKAYCDERKNNVDPKKWWNHYDAKGWMIGKTKMKNWKSAVHTWEETKKKSDPIKDKDYHEGVNNDGTF